MCRSFGFCCLLFFLSGCGVTSFAHIEYITFSDVDELELQEIKTFERENMILKMMFSNQKQKNVSEKNILSVDDIQIDFEEKVYGAVGLLPLLPPPPYIPVFFNILGSVCPVSSDVHMSISVSSNDEENIILQDYLKVTDASKIYLVNKANAVILPRNIWNDGYAYQVCFPLKKAEVDGAILFIDGITGKNGKNIQIKPHQLRYYSDNGLLIGYWGM
ncbi:MAG: hypothetical protein NC218_00160 [Acetobacter sp.]|nr:hypothetical protein [Acetobacter sp.]